MKNYRVGAAIGLALATLGFALDAIGAEPAAKAQYVSCPPMRPLACPSRTPMASGPGRFVDPAKGDDTGLGSEPRPWRTVRYALGHLRPGDTLYLRGGIYYERLAIRISGEKGKPITLRSYPSELAIIDGGYREFYDRPESAWEPCSGGLPGTFRSTKTYPELAEDSGIIDEYSGDSDEVHVRLGPDPVAGEANGVQRGIVGSGYFSRAIKVLGNFADSMVPLHGYYDLLNVPADDPFFATHKLEHVVPGVWYDLKTQKINVRLVPTQFVALGDKNYHGPTDPRKLPLVIGGPRVVVHVEGAKHLRFADLVLRGTRSRTLNLESCEDIEIDHLTVYGGAPAMQVRSTKDLRMRHSALRGLCAPWCTRSSEKYHGISCYLFIADGAKPQNENLELGCCEFTDNHDAMIVGTVNHLRFHHNYFDNFNDDGLYLTTGGAPGSDVQIFQNYLSRTLSTLAFAGTGKGQEGKEAMICRNVIDLRGPINGDQGFVYGRTCGDHGSPIWKPLLFYHNTVLLPDAVWRNYYAGGLSRGMSETRQYWLNNIFYYVKGTPGFRFELYRGKGASRKRISGEQLADGNLHWSAESGPTYSGDFLAQAREPGRKQPDWFAESKKLYPPGWTAHDRFADPLFVRVGPTWGDLVDLQLRRESPAIDAGVDVPADWIDPLREQDAGRPDLGALPFGVQPWRVGIDGRYTAFGNYDTKCPCR